MNLGAQGADRVPRGGVPRGCQGESGAGDLPVGYRPEDAPGHAGRRLREGRLARARVRADGDHNRLRLETLEGHLVAGMKWFQGTYTQGFNSRRPQEPRAYASRPSDDGQLQVASPAHCRSARPGAERLLARAHGGPQHPARVRPDFRDPSSPPRTGLGSGQRRRAARPRGSPVRLPEAPRLLMSAATNQALRAPAPPSRRDHEADLVHSPPTLRLVMSAAIGYEPAPP